MKLTPAQYAVPRDTRNNAVQNVLMPDSLPSTKNSREHQLREQFGDLLSTSDIAAVLRYRTTQAVRKARIRGALPIPMQLIPGRRGWFATARAVASYLDSLDRIHTSYGSQQ